MRVPRKISILLGALLLTGGACERHTKATAFGERGVEALSLPLKVRFLPQEKVVEAAAMAVMRYERQNEAVRKSPRTVTAWKYFLTQLGNAQATPSGTSGGKFLPPEIEGDGTWLGLHQRSSEIFEGIHQGRFPAVRGNRELYFAAGLFFTGFEGCIVAGDDLHLLLADRANELPVTKADVVAFYALWFGTTELLSASRYPVLEELEPYATAKNPVYRLIVLKALNEAAPRQAPRTPLSEDSRHAQLKFMRHYLNEEDPLILECLINSAAGWWKYPEAKELMQALRERQVQRGAQDWVQKIDRKVAEVEAIYSRFKMK